MPESGIKIRVIALNGFREKTLHSPDAYLTFILSSTKISFLFLGNEGMVGAQKIMTNK
jgi:hypothetical protein